MGKWKELSEGKTSNELVDVLLQEMASGEIVDSGGAEYFDGQVCFVCLFICAKILQSFRYNLFHYLQISLDVCYLKFQACIDLACMFFNTKSHYCNHHDHVINRGAH